MTEEALGRRAVAARFRWWRWQRGVVDTAGRVFLRYLCRGDAMVAGREDGPEIVYSADLVPDFAAPATLGRLADLTRAHLAALTDRDAAHFHGLRVASAWQDWFMGRPDRRALVMVEALETVPRVEVTT